MEEPQIEWQLIEIRKDLARLKDQVDARMTTIEKCHSTLTGRLTAWGVFFGVIAILAASIIGWHINQPYHYGTVTHVEGVKKEVLLEVKDLDKEVKINSSTLPVVLSRLDAVNTALEKLDKKLDKLITIKIEGVRQ